MCKTDGKSVRLGQICITVLSLTFLKRILCIIFILHAITAIIYCTIKTINEQKYNSINPILSTKKYKKNFITQIIF